MCSYVSYTRGVSLCVFDASPFQILPAVEFHRVDDAQISFYVAGRASVDTRTDPHPSANIRQYTLPLPGITAIPRRQKAALTYLDMAAYGGVLSPEPAGTQYNRRTPRRADPGGIRIAEKALRSAADFIRFCPGPVAHASRPEAPYLFRSYFARPHRSPILPLAIISECCRSSDTISSWMPVISE